MKKIISLVVTATMLISLSACNGKEDNTNETQAVSSQLTTDNNATELTETEITIVSSEVIVTETEKQFQVYSLDGMSGEEIFNHLVSISESIPSEKYVDKFMVEPYESFDDNYRFWGSSNASYTNSNLRPEDLTNYIDQYTFWIKREMDGTIIVNESAMKVELYLSDYEVAADLFDRVYSYLSDNVITDENNPVYDIREGTRWIIGFPFIDTYVKVTMEKIGDNYYMAIILPCFADA